MRGTRIPVATVVGGMENAADIPFADAGLALLDGACMMHRQANFYASNFEAAGASIAPTETATCSTFQA